MNVKTISIAVAIVLATVGIVAQNMADQRAKDALQTAQAAAQRQAQEKRDALTTEFVTTKIAEKVQSLIDQGDPVSAQALLVKFSQSSHPDVIRLTVAAQIAIKVKSFSDELAGKPDPVRSLAIYKELIALEPSNSRWRTKIDEITPVVAAFQEQQAKAQAKSAALSRRKEAIKSLFSAWDGSVYSVEREIKARLNDPDSYKHVETRFSDPGEGNVTIFTKYRARNAFNGVVLGIAVAVVTPTGELVSLDMR